MLNRIRNNMLALVGRMLRAVSLWGLNVTYLLAITFGMSVLSMILAAELFMRPGLAELLAGLLANYCLAYGQCDLNLSLAALAVALIAITNAMVFSTAVMLWNFNDDTEALDTDDLAHRLDAIDSQLQKQSELLDILLLPTEITPDDAELPAEGARDPDWLKSLAA
jgi:hypothetical protein